MVPGWHISCDSSFSFKLKVLRLVWAMERMCAHFIFGAKVVFLYNDVACKILLGVTVSQQDRFTCADRLPLSLKTIVGIEAVNNPDCVEWVISVQGSFLVARTWGVNIHWFGCTANTERFFVIVWVGLNLNFLTETDYRVGTENVRWFKSREHKNVPRDGSRIVFGSIQSVGLSNVNLLDSQVWD